MCRSPTALESFVPRDLLSVDIAVPRAEGYVDMFRPDGSFYRSIPFASFNICFGGASFVGVSNRGDGRINFFESGLRPLPGVALWATFDKKCGRFLSPAYDAFGNVLEIDGLGGVAPDPKKAVLYFAASLDSPNRHISPIGNGLFGRLTVVA